MKLQGMSTLGISILEDVASFIQTRKKHEAMMESLPIHVRQDLSTYNLQKILRLMVYWGSCFHVMVRCPLFDVLSLVHCPPAHSLFYGAFVRDHGSLTHLHERRPGLTNVLRARATTTR